jgi:flagellar hook-basal body complex protein FliE
MNIQNISTGISNLNNTSAVSTKDSNEFSFGETLKNAIDKVNDSQVKADQMTEGLIKGDNVEIHEVMLATEEAKLSLQLAIEVRNKVVEAYQELNRIQL